MNFASAGLVKKNQVFIAKSVMSCSTLLPVWCEYKHHIHSISHKEFHFKSKVGFEFDQTNENSLLKHSDGSKVSVCNEKLRTNSRFLVRSPRLSVHGYCGGLGLAAHQASSHHHSLSEEQGRKQEKQEQESLG